MYRIAPDSTTHYDWFINYIDLSGTERQVWSTHKPLKGLAHNAGVLWAIEDGQLLQVTFSEDQNDGGIFVYESAPEKPGVTCREFLYH